MLAGHANESPSAWIFPRRQSHVSNICDHMHDHGQVKLVETFLISGLGETCSIKHT